jgi:hypothetical protein
MATHMLKDLIEIGKSNEAADDLTAKFCDQGHFRDHGEP